MDGFSRPFRPTRSLGNVYWLGTDCRGRDLLDHPLRLAGVAAGGFRGGGLPAAVLGIALRLLSPATAAAGWNVMRIADVQLSFQAILVALLIFGVFQGVVPPALHDKAAIYVLILAIGLSDWVQYARTVPADSTLAERNRNTCRPRVIGCGAISAPPSAQRDGAGAAVIATIGLALAIILRSTLSFLGVGVPPTQPRHLIRVGRDLFSGGGGRVLPRPHPAAARAVGGPARRLAARRGHPAAPIDVPHISRMNARQRPACCRCATCG